MTPVEKREGVWYKRDDLFEAAGQRGGKARTCWHLAQNAKGIITAGSRHSPQVEIAAGIAAHLSIPCRVHVPLGKETPTTTAAREYGAEVIQHRAGYNTVIVARARQDAAQRDWTEIPFGMQCSEAVTQTAAQAENIPWGDIQRIVMPVGSGMSLAGVLQGRAHANRTDVPVLGVCVGADPRRRLAQYAPLTENYSLILAAKQYHEPAEQDTMNGVRLDRWYEAKCIPSLQPGDLLWVVGIRGGG